MGFSSMQGQFNSFLSSTASKMNSAPPAPQGPQVAKVPDYAAFKDATQQATNKGSANTFLTGSSGIDPGLLKIGKQTLLGG